MRREFTGRDMTKVLVAGFGVVFAVNMLMATLASRSFSGVVVENSYVASQKFNSWLEDARRSEELGWKVELHRGDEQYLTLVSHDVPSHAQAAAELRRPLGEQQRVYVDFDRIPTGGWRSVEPIASGRWIARVFIDADGQHWATEVPIE